MAVTDTSQLGDTIPVIIEKALLTSQFNDIMASQVWNKTKGQGKGSTVNIPYFDPVVANKLTETVDMVTSQTMKDTNVQVTLYEAGCKIILTNNAMEDDQEELKSVAGMMLGKACSTKRDVDLLALLDNGTVSLAGAGTTLTLGHLAAARAILQGNAVATGGPAPAPYTAVIHPYNTLDLIDVLTPIVPYIGAASTGLQAMSGSYTDDIIKNYGVGRMFGMTVLEDGNLPIDTSADVKGGVFAAGEGGGLILVTARNWNIEAEYDASLRGTELNCVGRYGVGNYLNGWTVELYCDATVPD